MSFIFHKRVYKKMNPLTANTKLSINKKPPESYDSDGFSPSVIIGFRKVAKVIKHQFQLRILELVLRF